MTVKSPKPRPVKAPRESAKPSRTTTLVVLGVAVLATAALIVGALVLRGGGSSSSPSTAPAIDFAGIPQESAVLGSPKAKVTLIEYADTQCPVCKAYTFDVLPTVVREYVRPGKVKNEYRGYPFIGPDSLKAERFLLAAAEQNKLWQLMDAFYRNQGAENSGWLTDTLIRQLASGVPGLDVDKLFQRAQSDELGRAAQQAAVDAQNAGIQGTPTLFVKIGNGAPYQIQVSTPEQMRQALDDALSG